MKGTLKKTAVFGIIIAILLIVLGYVLKDKYWMFMPGGDISKVDVNIEHVHNYTVEEANDAANVILSYFEENFDHCRMYNLWIVEEPVGERAREVAKNEDVDKALKFWSSFKAGFLSSFDDNYFWQWVMIQNEDGEWEIAFYDVDYV